MAKRILGSLKAGHTGTLDPFADNVRTYPVELREVVEIPGHGEVGSDGA